MTPVRRGFPAALSMAALLVGCGPSTDVSVHTFHYDAFATTLTVQIVGVPRDEAEAAANQVQEFLKQVEVDWYAYGTGELAAVNQRLARGESAALSPALEPLIRRAVELSRETVGRFDPSVGDLVALWGFDREISPADWQPPSADRIDSLLRERGSITDLELEGDRLSSRRPVTLDLNGIAKGSAIARAGQILRKAGIDNALVDFGGSSLLALGNHGDRPWRVGVRNPRPAASAMANEILGFLELESGESISTSGDYERYREADGHRYGHVLDPRTGYPVVGTAGVTVVSRDPELAEAASKALMVAGAEAFDAVSRGLGIDTAILTTTAGEHRMTARMALRLRTGLRTGLRIGPHPVTGRTSGDAVGGSAPRILSPSLPP